MLLAIGDKSQRDMFSPHFFCAMFHAVKETIVAKVTTTNTPRISVKIMAALVLG